MDPDLDWLSLDDDEEVAWADTAHPYSLVPTLLVGIPLSLVLVGLPLVAGTYLSHRNTHYVVSTKALYRKSGVLSRSVQRIEFDKVQDTSYRQSFFGTRFGYGSVDVSTAGGSGIEMSFRDVAEPRRVQTLVNERITSRSGRGAAERDGAAVLDDVLDELRTIRRLLEDEAGGDERGGTTEPDDDAPVDGSADDDAPADRSALDDLAAFDFDAARTEGGDGGGSGERDAPSDRRR